MNILFANYGDFATNSLNHIGAFANWLSEQGHNCIVAVPHGKDTTRCLETCYFQPLTFVESLEIPNHFPNARPADIVHAWTPRECVRRFVDSYCKLHDPKVIVHLEDNEEHLMASYYRSPIESLSTCDTPPGFDGWNDSLSHPTRWRQFVRQADGVTAIIESLFEFTSSSQPHIELLPGIDIQQFSRQYNVGNKRAELGIAHDERVVVYPGGITSSNREDIRSLYLAIRILNDSGYRTKLIKTGPSDPHFNSSFGFDLEPIIIDLGVVDRQAIAPLLSIADVLVQPGKRDDFNRYRLPSKLPEFLATGKPVITPATNIGLRLRDEIDCLTLQTGSPQEIATLCTRIFNTDIASSTLGDNGQKFASSNFSLSSNAQALLHFYESTIKAQPKDDQPAVSSDSEIQLLKSENQRLESTIIRIKNTASWKLTMPLRALRRSFLDPFRNKDIEKKLAYAPEIEQPTPQPTIEHPPSSEESSETAPTEPKAYRDYANLVSEQAPLVAAYTKNFSSRNPSEHYQPLISILLPVYNVEAKWLRKAIDSVLGQIYPNWELCIADDASPNAHIRSLLETYRHQEPRIKVEFRKTNGHISAASNSALSLASGEFFALLDHDDELPPHALARVVDAIRNNPTANLIYSDEDKIDANGNRSQPHFKSDWNPDLLTGQNFISHLGVYRRSTINRIGGFRLGYEGAQDWDLALRLSEISSPEQIVHIPEVLYHWRIIEGSTASDINQKDYAHDVARKVVQNHFDRLQQPIRMEPVDRFYWRARYPVPSPEPAVSIIIPTRDRVDLLDSCIQSILKLTTYQNYEIVIANNESTADETLEYFETVKSTKIRVLDYAGEFNFAAINNAAIANTESPLVCMLNNDITVITPDWLEELVSQASRSEIGIASGKLLYPHEHIQHAGIIMGIGGIASEAFKKIHRSDDGYIHRALLVGNYSAVTGACMAFKKTLWNELGGLRESEVPNAFGDVDFCLRANQAGYRCLFTPFAEFYHHESASRGDDTAPDKVEAFKLAQAYMKQTWAEVIEKDPYYNPNLTLEREDFTFSFPPRDYSTT